MRLTDNKKYRNLRAQKEKYTARDRRESELGVDTGHTDMRGNPIMSGSPPSCGTLRLIQLAIGLCVVVGMATRCGLTRALTVRSSKSSEARLVRGMSLCSLSDN